MRIKHMIPTAFTVGLAGSGILAMVSHLFLAVFSSIILVYLMATMGVSIMISKREGWEYLGLLPVSFGALHLGYGIGFSRGILEWLLFCRRR